MKKMLINATQQEELRVALVDGQQLYDLDIETLYSAQKKANIYKGKITRIEPSLEAVFVDYGSQRHGFLPFKEIAKEYLTGSTTARDESLTMKEMLHVGQEVLVQIEKEERGTKGAALTTYISLAGRFLVLMPNNPRAGGVSRRIQGDERKELRDTLDALDIPEEMGVIVRTAGVGRSGEELQWDLDFLMQIWSAITEEYEKVPPQRLIYRESNIIVRALRDYLRPDIGQIIIDNQKVYQQALDFMQLVMPANTNKVKLYEDTTPLFTRYQIEGQIESAYQRTVTLPSGGEIVIDYTEALVSVDINSSKATKGGDIEETAYQTNLEAADEIARQMRLRDLGGLIVIDFIDMFSGRNRKDIEQRLYDATKIDRARVQIGRISRFGLLELSRQRLRASIDEASHQVCPRCKGQGSIRGTQSQSLSILRLIEEEAMKDRTHRIIGELPVTIATYLLNEKRSALRGIEQRHGVEILLMPNVNLHTPDYYIERLRDDEIEADVKPIPSYRMELKHESIDDSQPQSAHLPVPEQPAVSNIVPKAPVPVSETSSKKGLSSLFSKVVSLFKEESKNPPDVQSMRDKSHKDNTKKSRQNGDDKKRRNRNQRDDNGKNGDTKKEQLLSTENNVRKNDANDNTVPKAQEKNTNNKRKNNRRGKEKIEVVVDEVNPSIEVLTNPAQTVNGREVRKGRPRDVHAVRGQGKAPETRRQIISDNEIGEVADIERAAVEDINLKQDVIENISAPEVNNRTPGLVSFLDENHDSTLTEKASDEKLAKSHDALNPTEKVETEILHEPNNTSLDIEEAALAEEVVHIERGIVPEEHVPKEVHKNPLRQLADFGQSVWYDNIHRGMLRSGVLQRMIVDDDLRGVTSNPAIFQKAFATDVYDDALVQWLENNTGGARDAFFALAIEDIQVACDQMLPVYERSGGTDGMVSLEVSPEIAHDVEKTIVEAKLLFARVARENVMIKVPGTEAGLQAITALIAAGVHVNVTLLFSVERYQKVLEAYIDGLKQRVAAGESIDLVRSVASFFVSRVDTVVDEELSEDDAALRGRAAVANAQMAYAYYLERISHDDWLDLQQKGGHVQRLLWASTGTKNPTYSDVRYVDLLIGQDTVNTIPPATYQAFKDHGKANGTLMRRIDQASAFIQRLQEAGVDIEKVAEGLEKEGLAQFEKAFTELLQTLSQKVSKLRAPMAESLPEGLVEDNRGNDMNSES